MAFVLRARDKAGPIGFYTGKTGPEWINNQDRNAFRYRSKAVAERKAELFNGATSLHGLTFSVMQESEHSFLQV
jgi:hypothetical protein